MILRLEVPNLELGEFRLDLFGVGRWSQNLYIPDLRLLGVEFTDPLPAGLTTVIDYLGHGSGETSDPVTVSLLLKDDTPDMNVILDDAKEGIVCTSGATTYVKFTARFEGPENCKGGVVPRRTISRGDIHITASSRDGSLEKTSSIRCRRGFAFGN